MFVKQMEFVSFRGRRRMTRFIIRNRKFLLRNHNILLQILLKKTKALKINLKTKSNYEKTSTNNTIIFFSYRSCLDKSDFFRPEFDFPIKCKESGIKCCNNEDLCNKDFENGTRKLKISWQNRDNNRVNFLVFSLKLTSSCFEFPLSFSSHNNIYF